MKWFARDMGGGGLENLEVLSFQGKTALVTGASGKLGRAIAIKLAELGADIYVHYNTSKEKANETASSIEKTGQNAYIVSGDLTNPEEVENIFRIVEETTGRLDILVNNAGYSTDAYMKMLKESAWDKVIDSNMKSQYLSTKYACKLLQNAKNSCVVNMASITGLKAFVGQFSYCTAKAGIIGMTRSMAKELGEYGIRVNSVSPNYVKAEDDYKREQLGSQELLSMLSIGGILSEKDEKSLIELTPLHRIATIEDVVNAVIFLCSSMSKCISGLNLLVDGGYTLEWNINA